MPFSTAEVLVQTSNAKKVEADRLNDLGLEQLDKSQFEAALQSFQQALAIYREIQDRKNELAAQGNLAIVYDNLGNYNKAIEYLQQVLAIAREIKDRKSEGKTLSNLGNAYDNLT
ncbi:tetratricopeptide repeat protein [Nostoc sp. ChiQUE01b]|uniref:tetratricopeptide repeat protein n=1 Tax=Nostoc sp. ChiQUE01b TaxID=3075376 RepID=UPI002AD32D8A|nr:tetratricopeptide repeat protein [Nostoc sp. ChiQUE01b]